MPMLGCVGKRVYATKAAARRRHPTQRVYLCPFGHGYHVASKVARRMRY